ncbi:LysM peptidoglycan-binding domain-containing protein [Paenibacillus sp. BSR1-1]|uniref:cell division suppressor protein YneA n=1 Tax=Paenibacillus sp. BSR1-1 TaxID=3020845 RepID=UPI0025B13033|nr:LysM peptidoglycan-binding domain-containing protein [Paenibacillus sp. BSR1-1]MDN3014650.1 LysM peptidoglycan-binding domain-containing protein [Paenibacillus sp. BSR1-1]
MKKIWNQYSFAIILMFISCSFALILSIQSNSNEKDNFIKVTVSEGDSLWELSDQYAGQHSLSNKEFVSWVKKHNKNVGDQIFPGDKILIPVNNEAPDTTQFASAIEE